MTSESTPHGQADHFSSVAGTYAQFRPTYPPALFEWLAHESHGHRQAWDCGTGSGQAAVALADHFIHVQGTDGSEAQLAQARPHPRVTYRAAWAGDSGLEDNSVDLACAAQAAHWFDLESYYGEVRRTARPGGLVALWCYGLTRIAPGIDELMDGFAQGRMAAYWPPGREHVDAGYSTLPFPFDRQAAPVLAIHATLEREAFLAYLRTWSAVDRCVRVEGQDPVIELDRMLKPHWPDETAHEVRWPISIIAGRLPAA